MTDSCWSWYAKIVFSRDFKGHSNQIHFFAVGAGVFILSCGEVAEPAPTGFNDDEAGVSDTGFVQYDVGAGLIEPGECLIEGKSGGGGTAYGYVYQCEALFFSSLEYTFDETVYTLYIPQYPEVFVGYPAQPYEMPKVMACCGEYDGEAEFEEQPQFALSCLADARQTACISLVVGLAEHAEDLSGDEKQAVLEIRNYINNNMTDCYDELSDDFPLPVLFYLHNDEWLIDNEWTTEGLTAAQISYDAIINDVYAPLTPSTCESLDYNNKWPFSEDSSPVGVTVDLELDEAEGDLLGPMYGLGRISAEDDFASLTTSCDPPFCSYATFSEDENGKWSIDELMLFADGPLSVGNGTLSETVDGASLELIGSARGSWTVVGGQTIYEVAAGDAAFIAAGTANGDDATLPVFNSTAITATQVLGTWTIDSFEIEYIDDSTDEWTLTVSSSTWLEI